MEGDHLNRWTIPTRPQLSTQAGVVTRTEMGTPRLARRWISADLGQAADYTAILAGESYAAQERIYQRLPRAIHEDLVIDRPVKSYRVTGAHRPRLGTTYPAIAEQIAVFLEDLPEADLLVDATGVGRGVIDILRTRGLRPIAITITGGQDANGGGFDFRVPKTELVSALIAVSQEGRLRISPELPLADVLSQEIAAFSPRMTATGHTTFEGRDGAHDDLVLALAIGIWHQERPTLTPERAAQIQRQMAGWMGR